MRGAFFSFYTSMKNDIILEKIKKYIAENRLITKDDNILVGLSGGADSTALILVLLALREELGFNLYALHLEHGIRGNESLRDAEFSKRLCSEHNVPFKLVRVDVPKVADEMRLGTEEAGRIVRYRAFDEYGREIESKAGCDAEKVKIAVAHHADDNMETVLFNLTRGSGLMGGAGIKPFAKRREGFNCIRPLLSVTRNEIEEYLKEKGQNYCVDATNEEVEYSRNKIRNLVIPELVKINAGAADHFSDFAGELQAVAEYIDAETRAFFEEKGNELSAKKTVINIKCLAKAHPVIQNMAVKKALVTVAGREKDITRTHVELAKGLLEMQSGRSLDMPYDIEVRREYDNIVFVKKKEKEDCTQFCPPVDELFEITKFSAENLTSLDNRIPKKIYTKWFDYDKIKSGFLSKYPEKEDRICIDKNGHKKRVLDYLKDEKVPAEKRKKVILLAKDNDVIWVVGHRISEKYKVDENTKTIIEFKLKTSEKEE
ncbi:MAG: tRNA lysidine(34) synthetase TilS [Lachnospiraceae bacterium]|nr:tRNA lysidine(34) synthetase TilS [Lachnospiraceae bacterium]